VPGLASNPLPAGCCGAAGTHMLEQPARAAALRAPLLDAIAQHPSDVLCSGNIGCRLHLAEGLAQRGTPLSCRHPIEILAACLQ
jgi:glycolate oxidase iron-sulfur subunit